VSGAGRGSYIKEVTPFTEFILRRLVGEAVIMGKEAVLPQNGRPVVMISSHGSLEAALPAAALVIRAYIEAGLGDVVYGVYPHWIFLMDPLSRALCTKMGAPTKIMNKEALVRALKSGDIQLAGTTPEGYNCHLQYRQYVGPFLTRGMIAAGILSGADMCLMAHYGGDRWAVKFGLPFGLTVPFTKGLRGVRLPIAPVLKIKRYAAVCERYEPGITAIDLEKTGKHEAHLALCLEAEKIRSRINLMTERAMKWVHLE
jgi:hypothetical protein